MLNILNNHSFLRSLKSARISCSLIFTLQSGFFYDQKDRLALDVLNNSEDFIQRLNHDPEMGIEIVNWIKDLSQKPI